MLNEDEIKEVIKYIKSKNDFISYNNEIFEITEGDLFNKVKAELRKQFTGDSGITASMRASPINILNKILNKLSKLYHKPPVRTVVDGNTSNQTLVDFYSRHVNAAFALHNFNYNAYKTSLVEIYENPEKREICFRAIPANSFLARSLDRINPVVPTEIIRFMGKDKDRKSIYWVYDKDNFTPITSDAKVYPSDLYETKGLNTYGILPFSFVTRSDYQLVPTPDYDILQMTLLIPVLISDQNFGGMFLSHPILYGINVSAENLKISPDHFWNVKSERGPDASTEIGVLRAEPDLQAMMNNVLSQLSIWLETKNIKPGTIGRVTGENYSSGISKLISEMETIEDRKQQAEKFQMVESDFWKRLGVIHNYLAGGGRLENNMKFIDPEKMEVMVEYQEESILESRAEKVLRLDAEVKAKFKSRYSAIAELNPKMNDDQIKEETELIKQEVIADDLEKSKDSYTQGL